jgi:uncharacterized membrane protein YfcA
MPKAELFAYLAAFVTIMLAIALTDMVQSAHRLLRDRSRVRWDLLTPLLALWVFLWVLSEFFSLWLDARFEKLTFYGLLGLIAVPTLTSLTAFAVLPDDVPSEGLDLKRFYYDNLSYFVLLLALINVADVGRILSFAIRFDGFKAIGPWVPYLTWWGLTFACLVLMYFVRKRWAQFISLIGLLVVAHLGFGRASIEALPTT